MGRRTKTGQKKHDQGVLRSAEYYRKQGYQVKADLPGMEQPESINRRRPDLIAKKGREEIILEVETKNTIDSDKSQHQAFKKYADKSKNRKFRIKKV